MKDQTALLRMLYVGTGLIIVVALVLAFLVIPSVIRDTSSQADQKTAVPGILFVIILHLIIAGALIRALTVKKRGGRIDKGLLIGMGVLLLLLNLMVLDGASAYRSDTDHVMHMASVSLFICAGFNFTAVLLIFLAAWFSRQVRSK